MAKISVLDTDITVVKQDQEDYISLTDIAKSKNPNDANEIIRNWLRNRNTIEFWVSGRRTLKQSNSTGLASITDFAMPR